MVATRGTRLAALALAPRLAGMAELVQITDKVHLARGHAVNWVLVTDDTGVLLIDAGYPGDRAEVLASLNKLGYTPGDVRAIVLTHAHIDHLGSAIWFAREHSTPVYCHAEEVGHAKREYRENASVFDVALRSWRPRVAVWGIHLLRRGGLTGDGIPTAQPLTAEAAAGLPGQPMAIFTPGTHQRSLLVCRRRCAGQRRCADHWSSDVASPRATATARGVQPQPAEQYPQPGCAGFARDQHPGTWSRRAVARADSQSYG